MSIICARISGPTIANALMEFCALSCKCLNRFNSSPRNNYRSRSSISISCFTLRRLPWTDPDGKEGAASSGNWRDGLMTSRRCPPCSNQPASSTTLAPLEVAPKFSVSTPACAAPGARCAYLIVVEIAVCPASD